MVSEPTITVRSVQGTEVLTVREVPLELRGPDGTVVTATLGLTPLVVGSGVDCAMVAADAEVSRRHCELTLTAGGVTVSDLSSKNGCFIQGVRVFSAVLPEGGALQLGRSTLHVLPSLHTESMPLSAGARFGDALGATPVMRALFAALQKAAATETSVLLLGETGTGKELLARAIHQHSPRRDGPFVVFDCGATAPTLIESELFGYLKGAFTGAERDRAGLFAEAEGGTLFLDEVGELPLEQQTRLLRALESRTFRPVGATAYQKMNVRVVAATHRQLKARVASGQFREDLYYRLAVFVAQVPALRERRDDIPLLVERMLSKLDPPMPLHAFPANALTLLGAHSWPGNVRELANTVTRLVLFPQLGAKAIDAPTASAAPVGKSIEAWFSLGLKEAREQLVSTFEVDYLRAKLKENQGNVAATAKAIGVSRQYLYRLLDQYGFQESSA